MKIEFTPVEAQATIDLIDIAVKAAGMKVAEAGLVLTRKIQLALQEEQHVKPAAPKGKKVEKKEPTE